MTGKQILVVEDETIVGEHIRRVLQNLGYSVCSIASSGKKAIMEAEEKRPDLVLMEIVLQGEMDGIDTASQIRSRFNIPVVYLTAYSDEKILERARITEPYGYIIKPFNERELHINIEIALYKHRAEREIKEKNQWLSAVIKGIGDAVIATDPLGLVKLMNPIAEALTGWKQEDASGKPLKTVFNIVSEEKEMLVENPVEKVIREGIFYGLADHSLLIAKEGTKIPVDIIGSTIKDDRGGIIGIAFIFYDIIERKRIEAQKSASK